MSKVIVTGGAGFIGSNLADKLVSLGHRVIILDNLSTGKMSNIESTLAIGKAEFIKGSITNLVLLRELFWGAEYVFHQAALPSVPRSVKYPRVSHNINITGTLNVLIAARDRGVKKVVYASSSSVYGDTPTQPITEDMRPNPLSPYAITKLTGEYYCEVFNKIYGLETVTLRYFNAYGPRQDPHSSYAAVIPLFFQNILAGKPPIIYGDGEQSRDFTFIEDIVNANIQAAQSHATGIFNVGNSQEVTINELVRRVIDLTGEAVEPVYSKSRAGDILRSLADISKARAAFGYNPRYSIEKGLGKTFEFFHGR
jgi:UDP-glucose 4-epimerase